MTDKSLLKVVSQFRKGVLGNFPAKDMCFAVCSPLSGYLRMCGVQTEMVKCTIAIPGTEDTYEHYYLQLVDDYRSPVQGQHRIIDPTASQFIDPNGNPMPEVYFGFKPAWYIDEKADEVAEITEAMLTITKSQKDMLLHMRSNVPMWTDYRDMFCFEGVARKFRRSTIHGLEAAGLVKWGTTYSLTEVGKNIQL